MRVALAGLGAAAQRGHLPAIERHAAAGTMDLVAAADPDAVARDRTTRRLPRTPLFASADAMLAAVECELVVIAASSPSHVDLVAVALQRGAHVLCEKPLALTLAGYESVARAYARHPGAGLVSVHQYRYSPGWIAILRTARLAARMHLPFKVSADVERVGVDALAASPWRADVARSGGIFADHGVHFLALAWGIDCDLDVLAMARSRREVGERASAFVRLGSGALALQLRTGAPDRHTSVLFEAGNVALTWSGATLALRVGPRLVFTRRVPDLADRAHVDALYHRLYDDIVQNLARASWRAQRSAETLVVGRALLELLDCDVAPDAALVRGR